MTKRKIGQVEIDVVDRARALAAIDAKACAGTPLMVAFCNAHTVNMADANPAFAESLSEALVLNDGIGVDIGSRILYGERFPDNLNGTDLTPAVMDQAACALRIFLVGSPKDVAEEAAAVLAARYPRHRIVGTQHGFFGHDDETALIDRIVASDANLLLVGMGHPRQEMFAARHWRRVAGVTMCIGAFLDFTAGRVSRAPGWVRALRSEWLYRLAMEPRRMARRYLIGNFLFVKNRLAERRRT
jgi:alpha-1,3-mannosyltransferase